MKLPIQESIRFGWKKFWERPWFFVAVYIVVGIFSANFNYGTNAENSDAAWQNFTPAIILAIALLAIAVMVIRNIVGMGEKRILLKAYANDVQSIPFNDLWTTSPFWKFFFVNIVYAVIITVGIILLIVPGIIWAITYMFAPLIVMDKKLKPFEALSESRRITTGHKWELFVFGLAIIGINILGFLCLFVGLLVSGPISGLATVYVYRHLEKAANANTITTA